MNGFGSCFGISWNEWPSVALRLCRARRPQNRFLTVFSQKFASQIMY